MKKLRNKRVSKMTVKDLKKALKGIDDDTEVVLGFYMKDDGVHFGYLAETFNVAYDSVLKERLFNSKVLELACYSDKFCTYVERKDDIK